MSPGIEARDTDDLEQLVFRNGDVHLHAVAAGPPTGPVILLLHGFPEFWYGWREQIPPLSNAGFRVIAPDQRGYNQSSKPQAVASYSVRQLVSDIVAIVDQIGCGRIYLAGHDWGGIVAWAFTAWHPEKVIRLAILNVPHPGVTFRFLFGNPRQLLRSWYVFFFQIPQIPEFLISARGFRSGTNALVKTSRPGTFSPRDLVRYREAWANPGALSGMINWYRALFRYPIASQVGKISVPTRILWGKKDAFLVPSLARASKCRCLEADIVWFDHATHWLHLEEPNAVNATLIEFFSAS